MPKLFLTPNEARDILYGDHKHTNNRVVRDEIIGIGRWNTEHSLVFQLANGKYYETTYSKGATEYQEERPFEYDDRVECIEVAPYEKAIINYKPVED
jgi:hypothetical protein